MPERGSLLARMPGSGVPAPVKSNRKGADKWISSEFSLMCQSLFAILDGRKKYDNFSKQRTICD